MQNESKDKFDLLKWDVAVYELLTAPLTDLNIFLKDLSKSISVGKKWLFFPTSLTPRNKSNVFFFYLTPPKNISNQYPFFQVKAAKGF
jgi:hypothetical protein